MKRFIQDDERRARKKKERMDAQKNGHDLESKHPEISVWFLGRVKQKRKENA